MKTTIIRAWMLLCTCLIAGTALAQYNTSFQVTEVKDQALKETINKSVSGLLSAFNVAQYNGTTPTLTDLNISTDALGTITKLWADCPFICMEEELVERAVPVAKRNEWQVRNIPLLMKPTDNSAKKDTWKVYQTGVITLDNTGRITNFHLALDAELYISVMSQAKAVDDFMRRQLILEYVERFRNAYNLKDMDFLQQIYSDDALIITGKVITQVKKDDVKMVDVDNQKIVYSKQNKKEYLGKLAEVFKNNNRINVTFDNIEVARHPAKENFYGVTLKQGWKADKYSDVGYLFLLWDFTNEDAPQIHVRTWQPTEINFKPVTLPEDEIFSVDDFDI